LTTPQWLQILLARHTRDAGAPIVILGSLPNLSMPEFLLRLVAAGEWSPNPVRAAIACVTLREWRGLAVRDSLVSVAAEPQVRGALGKLVTTSPDLTYAAGAIPSLLRSGQSAPGSSEHSKQSAAFASRIEQQVQSGADRMPLFEKRSYLYTRLYISYIDLRNWALNIHTDTARPVPQSTYRASLQLLELSLRYARSKHMQFVVYLAPVRPIEPSPILPSDLARFRKDVRDLCEAYSVPCLDYSYLVPEELWTNYPDGSTTAGERDYAHFTGGAHELV